jgi:hypothetical protein
VGLCAYHKQQRPADACRPDSGRIHLVYRHKRQRLAERIDDTLRRKSRGDRKRYMELYERHEFARLQVIGAEHEVRAETRHKG